MTERFVFPTTFDWTIFEDVNAADVRSLEDPTSVETNLVHGTSPDFFPETYPEMVGDANFYTGKGDDGGVHINSTIQSKCFNLLAVGGTQNSTTVSGIGIVNASRIAEFALVNLLPSNADFNISRQKWIAAAIFLFGTCSNEHFQTCKAWRAVNVGPACEPCSVMPICWDGGGDGVPLLKNQDFDDPINTIKVYPNPTNDKVNINLSELTMDKRNQLSSLSIIDNLGRVVRNIDLTLSNKMSFSIADLDAGIYLLKFDFSNEVQTIRLIKD